MPCWDVQNVHYCIVNNTLITGTNSSEYVANAVPAGKTLNGSITIVDKIHGRSVREIGAHSFILCTGITSVNILARIVQISKNAFFMCPNLMYINIPKTVQLIAQGAICTSPPDNREVAAPGTLNVVIEGISELKMLGYCGIGRRENIIIQYCSKIAPALQYTPFDKSSVTLYSLAEFQIDGVSSIVSDNACIFRNDNVATTCRRSIFDSISIHIFLLVV